MHLQLVTHGFIPVEGLVIRQMSGNAAKQPIEVRNRNISLTIQTDQLDWVLTHWWMNGGCQFVQQQVIKDIRHTYSVFPDVWVINLAAEFREWLKKPSKTEVIMRIDLKYRELLRQAISAIKDSNMFFEKYIFDPASYFEETLTKEIKEMTNASEDN